MFSFCQWARSNERRYKENILNDEIDKVDNIDRKDLLSKKEKNIKDRIPCLITYNRKLPMMCKIINKHFNVLQINPGWKKYFKTILLWHIKETKTYKKLQEVIRSKMEKCLKPIQKAEKENVNLATQVNHHYVASRLLTLVHSKVTKHSNYTPYFRN